MVEVADASRVHECPFEMPRFAWRGMKVSSPSRWLFDVLKQYLSRVRKKEPLGGKGTVSLLETMVVRGLLEMVKLKRGGPDFGLVFGEAMVLLQGVQTAATSPIKPGDGEGA